MAKIVRIIRLVRSKGKYMEMITTYMKIRPSIERIFATFIISFIVFHVIACIWYLIAIFDPTNKSSWVYRLGYLDKSTWDKYVACFYWTIQTVVTVGYGDFPAITEAEKIVACLWMFVGVFVYSFLIGSISTMFFS